MRKRILIAFAAGLSCLVLLAAAVIEYGSRSVLAGYTTTARAEAVVGPLAEVNGFSVEVLIDGRRTTEYAARGRRYIEALENAEYELRIHNPTGSRVAVALAVDGMNTIDARHSSAWEARKWVIEPYGTIHVRGWQMSANNARRFYFTTERDSYGAKIGQTQNLGLISAVFFRERKPISIMPVTPGGREERPTYKRGEADRTEKAPAESSPSAGASRDVVKPRSTTPYPPPDDESAATGIGRNVPNGVTWIKMDLDQRPVAEVTIRYEYREALVRLGILPRGYPPRQDVLNRRERAEGFEPSYCPQP